MNNFKKYITLITFLSCIFILINCTKKEESPSVKTAINRIVSLSPSITRQIVDLEAEKLLVGVTSYHPPLKSKIEIIGTLIKPDLEKILMLSPDIILYSVEDRTTQNIERLSGLGIKKFMFKWNTGFDAICENYLALAKILDKSELAEKKLERYRQLLEQEKLAAENKKIAFFVSNIPLMTVSGSSHIGRIINDAGGINVFNDLKKPYSIISIESVISRDPDIIISMLPNAKKFFKNLLKDFKWINAVKNDSIYFISPENVAHFTPGDYVKSVRIISGILKK